MKLHQLLIIGLFLFSTNIRAEDTAKPKDTVAFADIAQQCEKEIQSKITELQGQYLKQLEVVRQTYKGLGDLEKVLAVTTEKDRFTRSKDIRDTDVVDAPEELRSLQVKYQSEISQANQHVAQGVINRLIEKKKALTRDDKISEAMMVQKQIEVLARKYFLDSEETELVPATPDHPKSETVSHRRRRQNLPLSSRTEFDVSDDFSTGFNPTGPWSYGYSSDLGRDFHLYTRTVPMFNGGLVLWNQFSSGPSVSHNPSENALRSDGSTSFPPYQVALHPGRDGQYSIIRWTAPRSGRILLTGNFNGLAIYNNSPITTTDVFVFHNSQNIFSSYINLNGQGNTAKFRKGLELRKGDTIDFAVGYGNGNWANDTTGLNALITINPSR